MQIRVADLIDRSPVGRLQLRVVIICALVTFLDGLDIQAMSVAAPQISKEWGIEGSALGLVLSATLAGITIGAMLFGVLGDRFGRRKVLLCSFTLVGLTALLTAFAQTPTEVLILRLATGLGIGGALPNATALTAEYVPARKRILLITAMYTGVPLGASFVGFIAPYLIESFSWRAIFVVGGVVPLAVSVLMYFWLPESVRFLSMRQDTAAAGAILEKIDRSYRYAPEHQFVVESVAHTNSVVNLFREGRAPLTISLWLVFFSSFFGFYIITSWLPVIFTQAQWPHEAALLTIAAFQGGVVFGGLGCGWLIDRSRAFLILGLFYVSASVLVAAVGSTSESVNITMWLVALAGVTFGGAQVCIVAVTANVYPTSARATGVGWALGVGRTGAVVSPMVAGFAIGADWSVQAVFLLAAAPALICGLLALAVLFIERPRTPPAPQTAPAR